MLIANRNIRLIYKGIIISFCLLFFESCSIPKPTWYSLVNPIFLAYEHEMDFTVLQKIAEQDTFNLKLQDGGYLIYPSTQGPYNHSIWINDSLVLVKMDHILCDFHEFINQQSSKVRFEYNLRKNRSELINQTLQSITIYDNEFCSQNYEVNQDRTSYGLVSESECFNFSLADTLMKPVEDLHWRSWVFGDTVDLHFKKGVLDGALITRGTNQKTTKYGIYEEGFESGKWKIVDSLGMDQWTETWVKGELYKISYAKGSYLKREKRLPTLKETIFLHRAFFYFFIVLGITIFYFYIKSFRSFSNPYEEKSAFQVIGMVIIAPVLSLCTLFTTLIFIVLMITILSSGLSWDLPSYLYGFGLIPYYLFGGIIYYLATFRVQDLLWHAAFLMCVFFMFGEIDFLRTLEVGVF